MTHLTNQQLVRKRANDREAQRTIRLRNKERVRFLEARIELLEKREQGWETKTRELTDRLRLEYAQRAKLAAENDMLKARLGEPHQTGVQHVVQHAAQQLDDQVLPVVQAEALMPSKLEQDWVPTPTESMPVSTFSGPDPIYTMVFDDAEVAQQVYPATAGLIWDGPAEFEHASQSLAKPDPTWEPLQESISQPARYTYSPVDTRPLYVDATNWQAQPSPPAWQCPTKWRTPINSVDHLVMRVIEAHRQFLSGDTGGQLLGNDLPPVQTLINHPTPRHMPPLLERLMKCYNAVLSNRGFDLVPERLASFVAMYRLVQWHVSLSYEAYKRLYEWQRPLPVQLSIPHPAWMDFPPWPGFRERIIRDQRRYDNEEFQRDYVTNFSLDFPNGPGKAVVLVDGHVRVSEFMERYIADLSIASMRKPFAEKYPEFSDVCRFEGV